MSTATQVTSNVSNAESTAVVTGTIVRISATNAARRAQADAPANLVGTIGVAMAGAGPAVSFPAVLAGETPILLETGLTLLPGQAIYISATQAGKGTNVAPASPVRIGTIKNALNYATTALVVAIVAPPAPVAAAGGPSLIYISTGMNPTTGLLQLIPDTVTAIFFSGRMPACTVKNFRFETSSGPDPINVVVTNQSNDLTLEFEATGAGTLQGAAGLVFAAGQGMTIQGTNSAPGESGPWNMRGIFEVHFA